MDSVISPEFLSSPYIPTKRPTPPPPETPSRRPRKRVKTETPASAASSPPPISPEERRLSVPSATSSTLQDHSALAASPTISRAAVRHTAGTPSYLLPKKSLGNNLSLHVYGQHGRHAPEEFLKLALSPDFGIKYRPRIRIIHLELREEWMTDSADDTLAMALNCLRSDRRDGDGRSRSRKDARKVQGLRELHLHVHGSFLFTRNTYVLTSPAAATRWVEKTGGGQSEPLDSALRRFANRSTMTVDEREALDLRVAATPKAAVDALMQLTAEKVVIDGPMETALKKELTERITGAKYKRDEDYDHGRLDAGEVWEMERIVRTTTTVRSSQKEGRRPRTRASGVEDGDAQKSRDLQFVFPTDEEERIILGWRVE